MNATYRCKRSAWLIGFVIIAGALMFAGMSCMAWMEDDAANTSPYPSIILAIMCGGICVWLSSGGVYCLTYGIRHRLTIAADCVEWIGAFGTKQIDLGQVDTAIWRLRGGNSLLVMKSPSQKLKVAFSDYTREDARQLIKFFRLRLPESIQKDWDKYWQQTWRRFDEPDPTQRERFSAETRAMRWRLVIWVVGATVLALAVIVTVRCYAGDLLPLGKLLIGLLALPVVTVALAFLIPDDRGQVGERFACRPKVNWLAKWLFLLGGTVGALSFAMSLVLAVFDYPQGRLVFFAGGYAGAAILFFGVLAQRPQVRAAKRANAEAAKAAEEAYMRR